MTPGPRFSNFVTVVLPLLVCAFLLAGPPALAQSVSVTSANPSSTAQGTVNLNVSVNGRGFKRGATAQWFVTGTTNPGGVTVNSTAFVSSSQLTANITVSSSATISGYDIAVKNTNGGSGKGTDLFSVVQSGSGGGGCVTQGPAAGWTQVGVLNTANSSGTPLYPAGNLGSAVRVQLVSVSGVPQFYAGLAGSGTGGQAVAFVLNLDGTIRHSWSVLTNYSSRDIQVGDINGDGAPDFVMGNPSNNAVHLLIGHVVMNSAGAWDYNIDPTTDVFLLSAPAGAPSEFGWRVAIGDLKGDGLDEIAVGAIGGGSGKRALPGAVYIFSFNPSSSTFTLLKKISDPGASATDDFGSGVAIGELTTSDGTATGTRLQDLAVAASNAGTFYVFQAPLGSSSLPTLTFPVVAAGTMGSHVGIGDVTGDGFPDLLAVIGNDTAQPRIQVFTGPLHQSEPPLYTLLPDSSLADAWGTGFDVVDIDGTGRASVLSGAPNATYNAGSCDGGAAYVFRADSTTFPNFTDLFETPVIGSIGMGFSMAAAPFNTTANQPIVLIGETGAIVGTGATAGQVYVYRKTQ